LVDRHKDRGKEAPMTAKLESFLGTSFALSFMTSEAPIVRTHPKTKAALQRALISTDLANVELARPGNAWVPAAAK